MNELNKPEQNSCDKGNCDKGNCDKSNCDKDSVIDYVIGRFFFISNCKVYGTITSITELLVITILGHIFTMKKCLCIYSYLTLCIIYLGITGYWYKKQIKFGNRVLNNAKGQCTVSQCDTVTQQCLPTPHKCFIGTPDPYVTLYSKYVAFMCVFILGAGICCLRKNYGLCKNCDTTSAVQK